MSFLSDQAWQVKKPLPLVADCESCGLYKGCQSPYMKVAGQGDLGILIVGEAPGENEDRRGTPLIGRAGSKLTELLWDMRVNMRQDCWLTNAALCRPHTPAGNRKPKTNEVTACRPNLNRTLMELQPRAVILLGEVSVQAIAPLVWQPWNVNSHKGMAKWAGWQIPSQKLNAWLCPTWHPAFLLREEGEDKSGTAEMFVARHLATAIRLARKGRPWPNGSPNYEQQVELVFRPSDAVKRIQGFATRTCPVAFDFETTTLKPEGPHANIICCSLSDGEETICFPWTGETRGAMREFVTSKVPKVVSNLRFEERWCRRFLKTGVRNWFHDTVLAAHWLNCHSGIAGLKFQSFVRLGVEDYSSHLDRYMGGDGDNSPNRLREVDPVVLYKYCGMDSLLEILVAKHQREEGGLEWPT